jgi:uncharacterized membrane protein
MSNNEYQVIEISVKEIREKKLRLELMIAEMLYNFSEQTSVDIHGLDFGRIEVMGGHAVSYTVKIETEL